MTALSNCSNALAALIAFVALTLLQGCSTTGPRVATSTESADQALEILAEAADESATVEPQSEDTPPEVDGAESPHVPEAPAEPRFDLAVQADDSHHFFQSLVAGTPYNMVVHPDVNGTVTLDLKGVTVNEVMEIMRDVYGYDYVRTGNLFRVYPDVVRTEVFHVDYLNVSRNGRSEMQVSAGKVSDVQGGGSGSSDYGGNGVQVGSSSSQGSSAVVGTIVNTDGEADFWSELEDALVTLVGETGEIVITPQVGLVVARAKPDILRSVRSYLDHVQSALTRQVILEAKILEVTLNDGFQAGINWNTFGDASGGTFRPTAFEDGTGNVVTTNGSEHRVAGELVAGTFSDVFNPLGSEFRFNALFGDFDAAIDLLKTQGSVQVLSSPRIATVNNQKAVIKVGSDEFFVTDISTNTVTAGSAINTNDSPELTPFFSGIALDVTPQISSAGDVILHIHPTVSEVQEQTKIISGDSVPLASSTIRESDSIVRAANGQVVVIGGLMQNSATDVDAKVPWLSRLPVAGYLFKQKVRDAIKSELVILLKPIVVDLSTQRDALNQSRGHIEALKRELSRRG